MVSRNVFVFAKKFEKNADILTINGNYYKYVDTILAVTSNVDPNILNLDPDPGFWPNLDPTLKRNCHLKKFLIG